LRRTPFLFRENKTAPLCPLSSPGFTFPSGDTAPWKWPSPSPAPPPRGPFLHFVSSLLLPAGPEAPLFRLLRSVPPSFDLVAFPKLGGLRLETGGVELFPLWRVLAALCSFFFSSDYRLRLTLLSFLFSGLSQPNKREALPEPRTFLRETGLPREDLSPAK